MNDFDSVAYQAFLDAATEKYDFATCQRPDGSKYGSPGRCIKGSETSPASKDNKKGSSKSGGGGDIATAPAPPKALKTMRDPVAIVQKQQKENAALKKQMDKEVMAKAKAGKIKGVSKSDVDLIQARKSGGATMDKASRNEYGRQAKREQQAVKDIKDEMRRNGKTPELEKKLKQTEARAEKFDKMAKTGIFQK